MSPIILLFFVYFISAERCYDQSDFCRYLKTFCRSKDHESLMSVKCAATCGFCKEEEEEKESTRNETLVKGRPNETATTEEIETTTAKKCVFPKEKMLPNNRTDYTFNANVSTIQRNNETVQTILVQIKNSTRVQQVSDSNEALKRVAEAKRNESAFEEEKDEETRNALVMKKIKLNQLIDENDVTLPRVTTAEPSTFSVSLSKTLIKGKCFNEYIYCNEFLALCSHFAFSDVMAKHCTLTCQRCDDVDLEREDDKDKDCVDSAPDCSQYADLCHAEKYLHLAQRFCPKTCGLCKPVCRDRHQNCAQYALDGFCSDETYTVDERQYLCGSTCGSC